MPVHYKHIKESVTGPPRWQELADKLAVSIAYYERRGYPKLAEECRDARARVLERVERDALSQAGPPGGVPAPDGAGGRGGVGGAGGAVPGAHAGQEAQGEAARTEAGEP